MQARSSIFRPYDPLIKSDQLFIKRIDPSGKLMISLRPVWIIGDLEILHEWLTPAFKKANWELNLNRKTVYQHYKSLLISENAQSLMVEQNEKPIIQFDLFPWKKSNPAFIGNRHEQDCYLHFLYKENFRDPGIFKKGLLCLIPYLFSRSQIGSVYLQILKPDSTYSAPLTELGFEISDSDSPFQTQLPAYRLSRIAWAGGDIANV